jgi:hypothetical protein
MHRLFNDRNYLLLAAALFTHILYYIYFGRKDGIFCFCFFSSERIIVEKEIIQEEKEKTREYPLRGRKDKQRVPKKKEPTSNRNDYSKGKVVLGLLKQRVFKVIIGLQMES